MSKKKSSKIERIDYPIKTLTNGDTANLRVFRIVGESGGPHVHIQSSVHGAEVQGNAVIYELMRLFTEISFKGSVTFIPTANPSGLHHKAGTFTQGRFNPQSGNNWNRNYIDITKDGGPENFDLSSFLDKFESLGDKALKKKFKEFLLESLNKRRDHYAQRGLSDDIKLNLLLQKLAAPADIVLDLHTGPVATRYLYCGEYAKEKCKDFPFPFTLIIPNEFGGAMDEATFRPWVVLTKELDKRDRPWDCPFESYTVELGSEERISLSEARRDASRILHLLSKRKMIKKSDLKEFALSLEELGTTEFACRLEDFRTYYAKTGGLVEFLKAPGEKVEKSEALYRTLNFSGLHHEDNLPDCVVDTEAEEEAFIINHNPSAVIQEGAPVYQVMENFFER